MENINTDSLKLQFTVRPDGEYHPPTLTIQLPIRIQFGYTSESLADFKDELLNDLEVKESQVFKLIGILGNLLAMHDFSRTDLLGEFIELLADFGDGFTEVASIVRERFEDDNSGLAETIGHLDLSKYSVAENETLDLAKHISAVLNHPKTPQRIYNGLSDALGSTTMSGKFVDSPEFVYHTLKEDE